MKSFKSCYYTDINPNLRVRLYNFNGTGCFLTSNVNIFKEKIFRIILNGKTLLYSGLS